MNLWCNRPLRSHRGPQGSEGGQKNPTGAWGQATDSFQLDTEDQKKTPKKQHTHTPPSHPNFKAQILNVVGWIIQQVSIEAWYFLPRNKHPFLHRGHLNFKGSLASSKLICHRPQRILYNRNQLYCSSLFFQARTMLILAEPSPGCQQTRRPFVWRLSPYHPKKGGEP